MEKCCLRDDSSERCWFDVEEAVCGLQNSVRWFLAVATPFVGVCDNCKWLCDVFSKHKTVTSKLQAKEVFLSLRDDRRALCFAAVMVRPYDADLLVRSAEMGFPLAQALLAKIRCSHFSAEQLFGLAQQSASSGEREGYTKTGFKTTN
jgi:hypothetical protein